MINDTVQTALSQLEQSGCQYAFYYAATGSEPFFKANHDRFISASLIKVPILLAWLALEKAGEVSRYELCSLDAEPQVQGAGYSWLLRARHLPYQDVLLMMIAISDNLCTNLVIQRAGRERLNQVIHDQLGLTGSDLQRKLFDYAARARGLDNFISAQDCVRLYHLIAQLEPANRTWVGSLLAACQENMLLMRDIPVDTLDGELAFHHKTGSIPGVLHDWGYTSRSQIFLLTQAVRDEPATFRTFGQLGQLMLPDDSNDSQTRKVWSTPG